MDEEVKRRYKQITEEKLVRVLDEHEKWLKWEETPEDERPEGMAKGEQANLGWVDLREFGHVLRLHNLKLAGLWGAHLEGANLEQAYLKGANLSEANLERADLLWANLEGANLFKTNLENAEFVGANLKGVNLVGANLERADVTGVKYDRRRKRRYKNRRYLGIRIETCYGDPGFKRFCQDEEWLENFLDTRAAWWEKLWAWLWKWSSDYGRSIGRWALVSLAFVLIFSYAFTIWPDWYWEKGPGWIVKQTSEVMPEFYWDFLEWVGPKFSQTAPAYETTPFGFCSAFYFSVVTFTTLGFGDVVAANWSARLLVTLEVIMGYIMLGGLISIFANKLARRS